MALDKIFYAYMALVGIAAGAILVAAPRAAEYFVAPYFWVLIAVALFDAGIFAARRVSPAVMLTMNTRAFGFLIGAALMLAVTTLGGSPAKLF